MVSEINALSLSHASTTATECISATLLGTTLATEYHNSVRENLIHMEAVESVLLRTEAQIAGVVEPQSQRVPVSDQEPLTDVELCVVNQERSL